LKTKEIADKKNILPSILHTTVIRLSRKQTTAMNGYVVSRIALDTITR